MTCSEAVAETISVCISSEDTGISSAYVLPNITDEKSNDAARQLQIFFLKNFRETPAQLGGLSPVQAVLQQVTGPVL